MQLTRLIVPSSKYNIKCPYEMEAEGIAVHNTANKASAMSEVSYMVGNNNKVSFHCAVDDYRIVQGVEFNRNTWNAGDGINGKGNRKMIAVEICHSTNKDKTIFDKSEKLAAKYIAYLLNQKGWGIDKVYKHQDFNGKYCPHKTLDLGWERFLNLIRVELGQSTANNNNTNKIVLEWQKIMNKVYGCGLAEDNSFGPDSKSKANKYYLHYKIPTIKNDHVKFIQEQLCRHGYRVEVDRSFGPDCEAKIKQFQKDHGLTVDGYVGAKTTELLLKL